MGKETKPSALALHMDKVVPDADRIVADCFGEPEGSRGDGWGILARYAWRCGRDDAIKVADAVIRPLVDALRRVDVLSRGDVLPEDRAEGWDRTASRRLDMIRLMVRSALARAEGGAR